MNTTIKRNIRFFLIAFLLLATVFVSTNSTKPTNASQTFRQWDDDGDWEDWGHEDEARDPNESSGKVPAVRGAQPWMVALMDADKSNGYDAQFCGGSLIAPEWVLTAAHCIEGYKASEVDVAIGRYTLSSNDGERIRAERLISHPNYEDDHDIALIKLSRPATVGQSIELITDATEQLDDVNTMARITGWGILPEYDFEAPDDLHSVDVPVVEQNTCDIANDGDVTNKEICAGYQAGGKDACNGDSGGPLVVKNGNSFAQIGIVSWGDGCGLPDAYGVYVRLTEFDDWIQGHVGDAFNNGKPIVVSGKPAPETNPNPTPAPVVNDRIDVTDVTLPNAYELDDVYEYDDMTEAVYYSDRHYVSVITDGESYDSLDDIWLNEGGRVREINGVEVYIGRYSDDYGDYTEAVMVIDGQLIIVESSLGQYGLMSLIRSMV